MPDRVRWVLALVQLPSQPSRYRVAVWRELRRAGAVPVAAGAWALPAVAAVQPAIDRAAEICRSGGGTFALADVALRDTESEATIEAAFVAARLDEWSEFEADCGKFEAEIAREIAKQKFTFGELEEEEQSLDRLRRWFRDLKRRDVLELREARQAEHRLHGCQALLQDYAERVYSAMRSAAPFADVTDHPPE
ncbi:chromate resistance protein ChrB [Amnibacterium sp. CER49]|uniref:Chromate resistance protein ChrB n=1 Tax=Amnibacterium sp. CER49 TaxID=3039161 RepID=UPI00244D6E91|nr:Chromate resistance protein ChrB [Amnibacterium sp. CER49]MDH2442411.1 chromate resistance protein ChrB [Amnibacterium sp. CER49]